jgi:tetratricopeptide (TPR) repeat protein
MSHRLLLLVLFGAILSACSVGLRPRDRWVERTVRLAQAELAFSANPSTENLRAVGDALSEYSRHESVIDRFERDRTVEKGGIPAFRYLCLENSSARKWDEAISTCEKAAVGEPPSESLAKYTLQYAQTAKGADLIDLGMKYYSEKNWAKSIEVWNSITPSNPYYATSRSNVASAYIMTKEFKKADALLREALKIDPKNERVLNNIQWLKRESAAVSRR